MDIFYFEHPDHGTHICYSKSDFPALEKAGWKLRGDEQKDEISELRAKAASLGIEYHHRAGAEKLKELIAGTKDDNG